MDLTGGEEYTIHPFIARRQHVDHTVEIATDIYLKTVGIADISQISD